MGILELFVKSLAGLMLIIIGGLIPSAILLPKLQFPLSFTSLPSTFQLSALLLCSIVFGPRSGVIAAIAYITIGLFYIPVFHGGGSIGYLLTPNFGYIAGMVPSAWITGSLVEKNKNKKIIHLSIYALIGTSIIHIVGILNLVVSGIFGFLGNNTFELIYSYSVVPIVSQLSICFAIGIMAKYMRKILLIK